MTSSELRQSFLDFFRLKEHTIVPSSSLLPDSPNLLFTNAGMNQFVPFFLGQTRCPYSPGRVADTQKCIRAGGKHNDLDDVGLDTYHHTFFEMLGNWSFGDYFKKEAIDWAWELVVSQWNFPPQRLYATVYSPDKSRNDPSEFDQEAWDHWAAKFSAAGLDPAIHVVHGDKADNFWMMGETGPCGPCSELHVDLTSLGDTRGALVNKGSAECIEIWNLVFIQYNANPDGSFSPLPARHVDTGMGFERVAGILQNTKGFTTFNRVISNYETDIFRPLFEKLEQLSGRKYSSTLPAAGTTGTSDAEKIDVAFRVIADHIRTLSFAIADGIQPGNTDRSYVLRRILRRAVRYGRSLGFTDTFFYKLVDVVADTMGQVFPEIREKRKHVEDVIRTEEEAFNKTLDRGIEMFNKEVAQSSRIAGDFAFKLYDTYGFPLDLTELMARERGLTVEISRFHTLMEEQRALARAAQKKEVISLSQIKTDVPTKFVGYENLETPTRVLEVVRLKNKTAVILETSACYAEMGGQVGDTGELRGQGQLWRIVNTQKSGQSWLHILEGGETPPVNSPLQLQVDVPRRRAIERHHTVTHILHWALHEVAGKDASQKGSFVGPDKLTFDFNSPPLSPEQLADIEKLVNERILENQSVSWTDVPYAEVKTRPDVMQFFGDKYGDQVRVVQIGGRSGALDGYSMELCGGTHTRATGQLGLFRLLGESAIAAGVRRIEAVAGLEAYGEAIRQDQLLRTIAGKINAPVTELPKKVETLLAQQKTLEKQLRSLRQREAATVARDLQASVLEIPAAAGRPALRAIIQDLGAVDSAFLQDVADALKSTFQGVAVLSSQDNNNVSLLATVSPDLTAHIQAGKIIQTIAPIVGGRGGGRPDNARGGGKDAAKLAEALAQARSLLSGSA